MLFLCQKDYEEDFEEMDQSENEGEDEKEPEFPKGGEESEELVTQKRKEIEAIQRAMNEENERVETAQSRQSTSRVKEDDPKWSRGTILLYFYLSHDTCTMLHSIHISFFLSGWKTII